MISEFKTNSVKRAPPQRTQNSRIHAKKVFLEIHANPIFREIGEIFGKNRQSCQKSGKFAQICVKRENSRVHANKQGRFTHSRNKKMDLYIGR